MASNQTENYGLNQWEPGDAVLRRDFNADNAKIDAALAGKAEAAAVESLAAESLRIVAASHVGNGEDENIIKLPFFPRVFFIQTIGGSEDNHIVWIEGNFSMFQPSRTPTVVTNLMEGFMCDITDNRVLIRCFDESLPAEERARMAFNVKRCGYMYFAIG